MRLSVFFMPVHTEATHARISEASLSQMLDPEVAAVLLAAAFAGVLALPGLRKALRRGGQVCASCGRLIVLGERTCDCDR